MILEGIRTERIPYKTILLNREREIGHEEHDIGTGQAVALPPCP